MKYIITALLSLFLSLSITAQHRIKKEKMKALKIAFLTDELDLTSKEAEKFWPAYNAYDEKINNLRFNGHRKLYKKIREADGLDNLSESESRDIVQQFDNINEEIYETEKEFHKKLRTIFSYNKIIKFKMAELEFRRKLFKRYKNQKERKKERY